MESFWQTISLYNSSTWIAQIILVLTGAFLTIKLYRSPSRAVKIAIKVYMVVLNLWISVAYYLIYCSERDFNFVFSIFWAIIAGMWVFDLIKNYNQFERSYKHDITSYVLFSVPFIYPAISLIRGLHFPTITTPVMPCTVTIFSIGLLMSFSKKVNLFLVLFLFHWCLLGISKIYLYNLPEDILLTITAIPTVYLYMKEYVHSGLVHPTKPGIKTINALLLTSCGVIGIVFSYVIFKSFGYI